MRAVRALQFVVVVVVTLAYPALLYHQERLREVSVWTRRAFAPTSDAAPSFVKRANGSTIEGVTDTGRVDDATSTVIEADNATAVGAGSNGTAVVAPKAVVAPAVAVEVNETTSAASPAMAVEVNETTSSASPAAGENETPVSNDDEDLCKELVRASSDRIKSIELLTRAQFPTALGASEDEANAQIPSESKIRNDEYRCDPETARATPQQVLDVFLFGGGEIDTLEMRLYELHGVVDKFIAVTSNVTHKGEPAFDALRPLLQTKRFAKYRDAVEIFEYGQTGAAAPEGVDFRYESEKESAVATYVSDKFDHQTLVIFGHVDEIPAREDVWKVAHCERPLPGNFAIWFPFGNLDYGFRTDFPARGKPWSLGDPGMTTAGSLSQMGLPRGKFEHVLGTGFHATNYCFPPQHILKMMTATEYKGFDGVVDQMRRAAIENKTCAHVMQRLREECLNSPVRSFGARMRRVTELVQSGEKAEQFYVPLALRSGNFSRYPSWDPKGVAVDWRSTVPTGIV